MRSSRSAAPRSPARISIWRADDGADGTPEAKTEFLVHSDRVGVQLTRLGETTFHRMEPGERRGQAGLECRRPGSLGEQLRAPADCVRNRSRAVVQRLRVLHDENVELPLVRQLASVEDRPLERIRSCAPAARNGMGLAQEPPGLREPEVVADLLQLRDDGLGDSPVVLRGARGLDVRTPPLELDRRAELRPTVACPPCVRRSPPRAMSGRGPTLRHGSPRCPAP